MKAIIIGFLAFGFVASSNASVSTHKTDTTEKTVMLKMNDFDTVFVLDHYSPAILCDVYTFTNLVAFSTKITEPNEVCARSVKRFFPLPREGLPSRETSMS